MKYYFKTCKMKINGYLKGNSLYGVGNGNPLQYSFFFFNLFIYLAALSLSCGMCTLNWGMWGLVPWPGVEHRPLAVSLPLDHQGSPTLQYSCLENPMDRGAWKATDHGVTKSQTQLKWFYIAHLAFKASIRKEESLRINVPGSLHLRL